MHIVDSIFKHLGEATAIAQATGIPVQTVHSWKSSGNIPPWRRPVVTDLARKLEKPLTPEMATYLASSEKAPAKTQEEAA